MTRKELRDLTLAFAISMTLPGLAHAEKTAKNADIYSATESGNIAGIAPTGSQAPVAISVDENATPEALPPMPNSVATLPAASREATYDAVPLGQVDSILKRLKVVGEILEKFGRAYDYRIHTTQEFEAILARLEAPSLPPAKATKSMRVLPSLPAVPVTFPEDSDSAI